MTIAAALAATTTSPLGTVIPGTVVAINGARVGTFGTDTFGGLVAHVDADPDFEMVCGSPLAARNAVVLGALAAARR